MPTMEFWGVEVKSGQPQKINPGNRRVVHLSQASLGEVKKDKGNGHVCLYLKVDDKKLVLGTLSDQKLPQLSFDLVFEKDFELSHNWKNGSVYFTGYKVKMDEGNVADSDDSDSDEDVKEILLSNNGNPELHAKSVSEKPDVTKPSVSTAKNVKDVKPNKKFDDSDSKDSSTDDDETSDDEDQNRITGESDESGEEHDESDEDDDEDSDESESDDEDETPKKAETSKKRPAGSATKTSVSEKKTKFITPQKTGGKKGVVHIATPHPSKQAQKVPDNSSQSKQQTQNSGRSFSCKSCNRSFTTEGGLQAHTKAKHSAAA